MPVLTQGNSADVYASADSSLYVHCPSGWGRIESPVGKPAWEGRQVSGYDLKTGMSARVTAVLNSVYYELSTDPPLSAIASAGQAANSAFATQGRGVILVGDSIPTRDRYFADVATTGAYAIGSRGWWQYANAIMKGAYRLIACCGESGLTIAQVAAMMPAQAFPYQSQAQIAIVMAGPNDLPAADTVDNGDTIFARYVNQLVYPLLARGFIVGVAEMLADGATASGFLTTAARIAAYFRFNQLCREFVRNTPNTVLLPFSSKGYAAASDGFTPVAAFTADGLHPSNYGSLYVGKLVADVLNQFVRGDFTGTRSTDINNLANDPTTVANSSQFSTTNTASTTTAGWGAGATLTGGSVRPTGWTIYAQGNGMNIATSLVADTAVPAGPDWLQIVISGTTATAALVEVDGTQNTLATMGVSPGDWVEASWEVDIASPVGIYSLSAGLFFAGITGSGSAGANAPSVVRRFARAYASPFDVVPSGSANLDLTVLKAVPLPMIKIPAGTTAIRLQCEINMLAAGAVSGTVKMRNPVIRKVPAPVPEIPFGYSSSLFTIV